jgi:Glycosyl transferases group 1
MKDARKVKAGSTRRGRSAAAKTLDSPARCQTLYARMPPLSVVHACTHLRPLGGVQTLLRRHLRRDAGVGLDTSSMIWFERAPFEPLSAGRPVTGLGLRWFDSGWTLRRRLRRQYPATGGEGAVWAYHDLWGLPTAADLDRASRRVGVIHSQWEATDALLTAIQGQVDGMLCISAATVALSRARLPGLSPDRILLLPLPVDPPASPPRERDRENAELVIGYCGRIQRHQKRVERLPFIASALRTAGMSHRWELLGTGPDQPGLEHAMASVGAKARFHGVQTGDAYWNIVSGWDVIVFTSDFEGLPIAMLEAMIRGVIPVFPDVDCGGRDYARRVAPELVYPAADLPGAARVLTWLQGLDASGRRLLQDRARDAAAPHGGDAYGRTFSEFSRHLRELPRLSSTGKAARKAHPGEWVPYGLVGRLPPGHPLRRGYL